MHAQAQPGSAARLAHALRLRGRRVVEQIWQEGRHGNLLEAHGEEYQDALAFLLGAAMQVGRMLRVRGVLGCAQRRVCWGVLGCAEGVFRCTLAMNSI